MQSVPAAVAYVLVVWLTLREHIGWLEDALTASLKLENKQYKGLHIGNLGYVLYKMGKGENGVDCYAAAWCSFLYRKRVRAGKAKKRP